MLQHDDGKVVTKVPMGDMSADLVEQPCQGVLDRARTKRCARVEQLQELTAGVPRFAEAVGVEQQPVSGVPCHGRFAEVVPDPEGQPGGHVHERDRTIAADQDGGRMPGAGECDAVRRALHQKGGGELLGPKKGSR